MTERAPMCSGTYVQKIRNWWMKWRSTIAKLWLWTALVGVSVGFGFLWTHCNPTNQAQILILTLLII